MYSIYVFYLCILSIYLSRTLTSPGSSRNDWNKVTSSWMSLYFYYTLWSHSILFGQQVSFDLCTHVTHPRDTPTWHTHVTHISGTIDVARWPRCDVIKSLQRVIWYKWIIKVVWTIWYDVIVVSAYFRLCTSVFLWRRSAIRRPEPVRDIPWPVVREPDLVATSWPRRSRWRHLSYRLFRMWRQSLLLTSCVRL